MFDVPLDAELDDEAEAAPVAVFHPNGRLQPIVFVRSWMGELEGYQRLAAALGPERPLYTIAPPRGEQPSDFPDSVAGWAAWCRERIGDGMLGDGALLGGVSFGGVLALEIARQLESERRRVARVLMLDSWLPRRSPRERRRLPHKLLHHVSRALDLPPGERLPYLRGRASGVAGLRTRLTRRLRPKPRAPEAQAKAENVITSTGRKMPLLKRAIWVSYLRYQPEPCSIPVSLFRCEGSRRRVGDAALGWTPWLLGPLEIQPLDGAHLTFMNDEYAPGLARCIERSLDGTE